MSRIRGRPRSKQEAPKLLDTSEDPRALQVKLKLFRNLAGVNMERLKEANGTIRVLMR